MAAIAPFAQTAHAADCAGTGSATTSDFDGDGRADLAIGSWREDLGVSNELVDAGSVKVVYGCTAGLDAAERQLWHQDTGLADTHESNDLFGYALATGDFNGDGKDDLAVGAPGETLLTTLAGAGVVHIVYGGSAGLSATNNQLLHQNITDVEDTVEADDYFGYALAAGDFNGDGKDDLAIGAPREDIGTIANAGAAHVVYGSASGLSVTAVPDVLLHQDADLNGFPVEETSEANDFFGVALAAGDFNGDGKDDLAAGVSHEDLPTGLTNTGGANVFYGGANGIQAQAPADQFWSQKSAIGASASADDRFGSTLAAGNFNGDARDDLAVGSPGEDVMSVRDAGMVQIIRGATGGLGSTGFQLAQQDTAGMPGIAEPYDQFAAALAVGRFNSDGYDDLVVGTPGEETGGVRAAGAVSVMPGSSAGVVLSSTVIWHQNSPDVEGTNESTDRFGTALRAADFNGDGRHDLAIGVPYEDDGAVVNAGAFNVLYASSAGSGLAAAGDQLFTQTGLNLDLPEESDGLGLALG